MTTGMDPRIILERLDDHDYYIVRELATGVEIGGVVKRYREPGGPWCALTPENAAHDVWRAPIEGAAVTKEEAAEFLLPHLREPQL